MLVSGSAEKNQYENPNVAQFPLVDFIIFYPHGSRSRAQRNDSPFPKWALRYLAWRRGSVWMDEMDRWKIFGDGTYWKVNDWLIGCWSLVDICYGEHHVQTPNCQRSIRSGVPITGEGDLLGFQQNRRRATKQLEGYNNQRFWCFFMRPCQNQKVFKHMQYLKQFLKRTFWESTPSQFAITGNNNIQNLKR